MEFRLKKPSKKIIIGSLVLSLVLHLFVCKLPGVAFQQDKKVSEIKVPNVVPIQIVSIAAPRIEASVAPKTVEEPVKEIKKETEIKTKIETETAQFNFSKKEENLKEVKQLQKPKSLEKKEVAEQPQQQQQIVEQPQIQAQSHGNFTAQAQLTSNDNGNAATTIIPVLKNTNFTQTVAPNYPNRSIQLGQEGKVLVRALVDSNGNIQDVTIHTSSGHSLLDESARRAVSQWRFQPAVVNGRSATSWIEVPVDFSLRNARS